VADNFGAPLGGDWFGALALIVTAVKFLWEMGDRYEKKLAATILASGKVKAAVGDVALAAVIDSEKVVMTDLYDEQRRNHEEKLDKLITEVAGVNEFLRSDQLARAVVAAMSGNPTRRDHPRNT
jgi:hypothetical protein